MKREEIYLIEAKPTYYKHVLYRSRLEARWAAFFDFMGWEFEYEPEPFKTWSPDFVIHTLQSYAEVKPYSHWSDDLMNKIRPYSLEHRCALLSEDITIRSEAFYIGKYFNRSHQENDLILKDFTIPYRGNFNPGTIEMLWREAQNKVMYLKPKQ